LHWAREKSTDHADCLGRHLLERGKIDKDGERHTTKAAWRILAMLQLELEKAAGQSKVRTFASGSVVWKWENDKMTVNVGSTWKDSNFIDPDDLLRNSAAVEVF
jgi:hypothetical protein